MLSIIIPTYNEAENLPVLLDRLFSTSTRSGLSAEAIIVDDDSPDETWKVAERLKAKYPLKVLRRRGKRGLSTAVFDGFRIAEGDTWAVMDADLSHPPEKIPEMISLIEGGQADFVLGSRYVDRGGSEGWPLRRRIASRGAALLAKLVTNVKDPMAGFFVFRREILDGVDLNPQGFKIGLEILVKARHQKVCEVPIVFRDRLHGESKLPAAVAIDYLAHVLRLFLYRQKTLAQFAKFCVVGSVGVFVNLLVYTLCLYVAQMHYMVAATLSFVVAVTNNFFLNQAWTFRGRFKVTGIVPRYARFFSVSLLGYVINLLVLYWLVEGWHVHELLSQFIAILIATTGNFLGSKAWVFKK